MKKIRGEKQERFAFRKLSHGLVSAAVASLFFISTSADQVAAQTTSQQIRYQYVAEQELTPAEKNLVVREMPNIAQATDATYYLIYKPVEQQATKATQASLPSTGSSLSNGLLAIAGLSFLVLAFKLGKDGKKHLVAVALVSATGLTLLSPAASALTGQILAHYNQELEVTVGQELPAPMTIPGYRYVGYLKDSRKTEISDVTQQTEQPTTTEEVIQLPDTAPSHELPAIAIEEKLVTRTETVAFDIQEIADNSLTEGTR
ncbi:YSIRK-type signal peptide-containing protein [Streptococcus oriscaviae]|uniref:YSIRK-type signal peptide-containing protein n=1 Tax=Streptococcus oriscaviae TaxID=2781599 RepID=A0ABX7YMM1_9STRE|nr:YSIRK-type signal peptide-containing protein [Streptococcus oriscaviae]QUE54514.1 YSIRK-type signal peptide-containing protein [Streptococcus oriscaviae]